MPHSMGSNVGRFPRVTPVRARQTELPLGPNLAPIISIRREIEVLSMDSLVTQGPVHPDFRLIGLCAETLQQARRIQGIQVTRLERSNSGKPWTDGELADDKAILETQQALRRQVVAMVKRASKIRARSPASIYF